MPALHVRKVPEAVVTALRERAAAQGHSMQEEIRGILAAAATAPRTGTPNEPVQLVTVRARTKSTWRREEIYDDTSR